MVEVIVKEDFEGGKVCSGMDDKRGAWGVKRLRGTIDIITDHRGVVVNKDNYSSKRKVLGIELSFGFGLVLVARLTID